jgi:hypothetical protein
LLELLTNFCVFPEPTPGHTFGTNVLLNNANLDQLETLMTEIAKNVVNSADFIEVQNFQHS